MATPHNAARPGDIAPVVLFPGDPLRAQYIADRYLAGSRQVTGVRNMLGFTGTWNGTPVSVMGSGMGGPSAGIYSYELFRFYGVEKIIRIGTAGGLLIGKVMCVFSKGKINPLIGSAGVSAVPMAARISHNLGQEENPGNYLLMHAMGPNVAGVIGSAVAAGVLLAIFGA